MGQSAQGITVDMLQHVNRWFLPEETVKAANAVLIKYRHQLPLSSVWGGGLASSDGQGFGLQQKLAAWLVLSSLLWILQRACHRLYAPLRSVLRLRDAPDLVLAGEAFYVLDGLLENNTILRLR